LALDRFDRIEPTPIVLGKTRQAGACLKTIPHGLQAFTHANPSVANHFPKSAIITSTDKAGVAYKSAGDVRRAIGLAGEAAQDCRYPATVLSAGRIKRKRLLRQFVPFCLVRSVLLGSLKGRF
jgi:hypothetical protein